MSSNKRKVYTRGAFLSFLIMEGGNNEKTMQGV